MMQKIILMIWKTMDKLREQKGTASKQVTTTQATVDQLTEGVGGAEKCTCRCTGES